MQSPPYDDREYGQSYFKDHNSAENELYTKDDEPRWPTLNLGESKNEST